MIRFSQYGDFNDPFELNSNINKIAEEDEIRRLADKDFKKLIEEEYSNHPIVSAFISKEAFIQLAEMKKESIIGNVIGMERQLVDLLPGMLKTISNSMLGALSLSEICTHELMWPHYAEDHKGFVIGFNCDHPFFNQKISDADELRHLKRVDYREVPPVISLMNVTGTELYFVKSKKWSYESEWRMLMPLSDSSKVIERQPYPIHLFSYPAESVSEVILGARMSEQDKKMIQTILGSHQKYSHVKLSQACLDNSTYNIFLRQV
ncbi:MAG: DUF2971 domain-containing protein [Gammaproteobacteria bacterium]|nr:DUF2971 domain-containing protein [Gammaproteobacteria bacterium]